MTIGEIADLASRYDDTMPEVTCHLLYSHAGPVFLSQYLQSREGKTFAAGGQCLRAMYDAEVKRKAKREE